MDIIKTTTSSQSNMNVRLENLEVGINRGGIGPLRIQPAPVSAMKEGIPLAIYNQIVADVVRRYPTDYSMQKILIDDQVASYKKLHP